MQGLGKQEIGCQEMKPATTMTSSFLSLLQRPSVKQVYMETNSRWRWQVPLRGHRKPTKQSTFPNAGTQRAFQKYSIDRSPVAYINLLRPTSVSSRATVPRQTRPALRRRGDRWHSRSCAAGAATAARSGGSGRRASSRPAARAGRSSSSCAAVARPRRLQGGGGGLKAARGAGVAAMRAQAAAREGKYQTPSQASLVAADDRSSMDWEARGLSMHKYSRFC
jgi:hypothetical protein